MNHSNSATLNLSGVVFLAFWISACMDFGTDIPSYETDFDIMPNADRYVSNAKHEIDIQGDWYWYNNLGSIIHAIDAEVSYSSKNGFVPWYPVDVEIEKPEEVDQINTSLLPVNKICIKGSFAPSSGDDERYVGLGFELCSVLESGNGFYKFPLTLGICPLGGNETILRRFLGISFKIEPYPGKNAPEYTKFLVQFKERGKNLDRLQPFCIVRDNMEFRKWNNQVECDASPEGKAYRVRAWHASSFHPNRAAAGLAERNLSALQGIHFQVESDNNDEFSFCLSEISAIATREKRTTGNFGEPFVPEVMDTDFAPTQLIDAGISPADWVKVERAVDSFEMMKKEVSVEQYRTCLDQKICGETNSWESCNVYKYGLLSKIPEQEETAEALRIQSANCITWQDALIFCKSIGGDLPTQEQWEYAASSGDANANCFPWGESPLPECTHAVIYGDEGIGCGNNGIPEPGCLRPLGNTKSGEICDMVGNLWEWVKDAYPQTEEWMAGYKTIKGGSFDTPNITTGGAKDSQLSIVNSTSLEHAALPHNPNHLGFRCIRYPAPL